MFKIKIAVVGPARSGKTTITNFLADAGDSLGTDYVPTIGCRIIEIEQDMKISNRSEKFDIEIWDCSGDLKYDTCWPALSFEANGVVFVFNARDPTHAKELNQWYAHFVQNAAMREECCLVIANKYEHEGISARGEAKLSNLFDNVKVVAANMEDESEQFRNEFKSFVQKVAAYSRSRQDQEEKMILR